MTDDELDLVETDAIVRALIRRTSALVFGGVFFERAGERTYTEWIGPPLVARTLLGALDKKIMDFYEQERRQR